MAEDGTRGGGMAHVVEDGAIVIIEKGFVGRWR